MKKLLFIIALMISFTFIACTGNKQNTNTTANDSIDIIEVIDTVEVVDTLQSDSL